MQYYKTEITELAENDLMDIGNHITYELQNPKAALNIIKGISKEIFYLVDDVNFIVYVVRIVHRLANNRIWIYHTYDFKEKK